MSKFKIKLKLQALEVEIEGTREDIPAITSNVSRQLAEILQPASDIVEGEVADGSRPPTQIEAPQLSSISTRARKRRSGTQAAPQGENSGAVDWIHDPSKWGSPAQEWSTATKSIWLLYVVKNEVGQNDLPAPTIANTFNKHFRQSGPIHRTNTGRDLGKLKKGKDSPVGEDTTKSPSRWFLTDTGIKRAEQLVIEAKSGKSQT